MCGRSTGAAGGLGKVFGRLDRFFMPVQPRPFLCNRIRCFFKLDLELLSTLIPFRQRYVYKVEAPPCDDGPVAVDDPENVHKGHSHGKGLFSSADSCCEREAFPCRPEPEPTVDRDWEDLSEIEEPAIDSWLTSRPSDDESCSPLLLVLASTCDAAAGDGERKGVEQLVIAGLK